MNRATRFALLAGGLSVVATWPWALLLADHTGQQVIDPDLQCGMWWPSQFADALVHLRYPFFDPDLLWPRGQDTTLLIWNFGAQLLFLPIHLLTAPVLGMNLASLATLVVNALACAWAGRRATRSDAGALAGLLVGATDAYAFAEGLNGRPEQALWAPNALYLGALAELHRAPGQRRWILAAGASLAAAGAVYWFYAYFLVLLTLGLAGARAMGRRLSLRGFLDLAAVGGVSAVLVLPFLAPVVLATLQGTEVFTAVKEQSEDAYTQQVMASILPGNLLWPLFPAREASRDVTLFLLPLLLYTVVHARGAAREVAGMGLAALLFALGPVVGTLAASAPGGAQMVAERTLKIGAGVLYLPGYLLNVVPGYERFWWPYRWLGVALPALAVAAAWVVSRSRHRVLLLGALAVGGVAQMALALRTTQRFAFPFALPPVLAAIAEAPNPAPILQLPRDGLMNSFIGYQAVHGQPIDGGVATNLVGSTNDDAPLLVRALGRATDDGAPPRATWTTEEAGGFHYVVLYAGGEAQGTRLEAQRVTAVLGAPFYDADGVTAWVVPGVGALPPGLP